MGTITELSLCYSLVCRYDSAQWYEILLGSALLSSKRLCVWSSRCSIYIYEIFCYMFYFTFSELSLVGLALDVVDFSATIDWVI